MKLKYFTMFVSLLWVNLFKKPGKLNWKTLKSVWHSVTLQLKITKNPGAAFSFLYATTIYTDYRSVFKETNIEKGFAWMMWPKHYCDLQIHFPPVMYAILSGDVTESLFGLTLLEGKLTPEVYSTFYDHVRKGELDARSKYSKAVLDTVPISNQTQLLQKLIENVCAGRSPAQESYDLYIQTCLR